MKTINRILIANRGEIACRVVRTVREMGLRSVAVYSEADAGAPHVRQADDAVCIGPPPVSDSYLNIGRIIAAARKTGADAIHPGYGFLSENDAFANACADAGIIFIGPSADAIVLMGNKAAAKRRMAAANVSCIPGYEDEDQSDNRLIAEGERVGFPLMVKAAAGGGGRGMRLVETAADLPTAIERARSEAVNAFGSGELILERAVAGPRHVEIQILADRHGNVVHLGERDCSVQRRHQKVIEESPCPVMTPDLRQRMGKAAIDVAAAIDYVGAGTVEFLLDAERNFYFLEMNTRLQVEHPVTELVTGLDLVAWQIRVAQGEALAIGQADVGMRGHAIEARLYAEDPAQDFLPATGTIDMWRPPSGAGIRVDDGIASGLDVSAYYDAMVAKIVAHGPTRDIARRRLVRALKDTVLFGPTVNKAFLIQCLEHDVFCAGDATTSFIGDTPDHSGAADDDGGQKTRLRNAAVASVLRYVYDCRASLAAAVTCSGDLAQWSSGYVPVVRYAYQVDGETITMAVRPLGKDRFDVVADQTALRIGIERWTDEAATVVVDGNRLDIRFKALERARLWLSAEGEDGLYQNRLVVMASREDEVGGGRVAAPMHGVVRDVCVGTGDTVQKGQRLVILEAMKMQHEITASVSGMVESVHTAVGAQVASDDHLMTILEHTEPDGGTSPAD